MILQLVREKNPTTSNQTTVHQAFFLFFFPKEPLVDEVCRLPGRLMHLQSCGHWQRYISQHDDVGSLCTLLAIVHRHKDKHLKPSLSFTLLLIWISFKGSVFENSLITQGWWVPAAFKNLWFQSKTCSTKQQGPHTCLINGSSYNSAELRAIVTPVWTNYFLGSNPKSETDVHQSIQNSVQPITWKPFSNIGNPVGKVFNLLHSYSWKYLMETYGRPT